jgi:hypothetical protein
MRRTSTWISLAFSLITITTVAGAQTRKPGLWDVTSTTIWQQSPFPTGATPAALGGIHTTQVCLTQAQIDRYGAILPESHNNSCQVINLVKKSNGMTADMVCTGRMSGKSSMEASWSDDVHATGKVHFVGAMQLGQNSKPIEWTSTSSSTFKGADCGSVKPLPMPDK